MLLPITNERKDNIYSMNSYSIFSNLVYLDLVLKAGTKCTNITKTLGNLFI